MKFAGSLLRIPVMLGLSFALSLSTLAQGQDKPQVENYMAERARAMALYQQQKMMDALPLLERLHAVNPKDTAVHEALAWATFTSTAAVNDPEAKKKARIRARTLAYQLKEQQGEVSNLVQILLELPADGGEPAGFSKRKDVEDAMREGEAAFVKGDFKKAIEFYERALQLDPKLYEAALFIGDVYFKQEKADLAGEWFAKAIAIDPDRETAHRYWGDALARAGKAKEAQDKFIEAIIAEPYNRRAWVGLVQWAEHQQIRLAHPLVKVPTSVTSKGKNETNITLDMNMLGKKDGSSGWMMYGIVRANWMNEKFLKEYPNEKTYRHSLREEVDALDLVVEGATNELKESKGKEKADVSIANLLRLHEAGLLEPFILFAMPDQGIAQDYDAYRKNNRDKLRRYLNEVVLNGGVVKVTEKK